MGVNLFEKIREFLHFNNNVNMRKYGTSGFDPLFKIRPIIESTMRKFLSIPFEEKLCIDEQICSTKCHHRFCVYA